MTLLPRIRFLLALLICALSGCASAPPAVQSVEASLFRDVEFQPRLKVEADIFAVSPAMQHYLQTTVRKASQTSGKVEGLLESLYSDGKLLLEYDSTLTRTAAQAFDARSGNCLSLAIMTAALARQLGLIVHYQEVLTEELWTQDRGYIIAAGHVNLTLGRRDIDRTVLGGHNSELVVDFLPRQQLRGQRSRLLTEARVTAMYHTNRSAESLVQGDLRGAYWQARAAVNADPAYAAPYNTLAVIYRRQNQPAPAEAALRHALKLDPANTRSLANLAALLEEGGRSEESKAVMTALQRVQPEPPFYHFQLAKAALQRGEYSLAQTEFREELRRNGQYAEAHRGLAAAHVGLGQMDKAREQLALAVEKSTSPQDVRRNQAKQRWLNRFTIQ